MLPSQQEFIVRLPVTGLPGTFQSLGEQNRQAPPSQAHTVGENEQINKWRAWRADYTEQ